MPLVRITLREGKPDGYRRAIADGVHRALVETFGVPETGRLQMIKQLRADEFVGDPHFGGIPRTDDLVIIQITAAPRPPEQRRVFFTRTAELLAAAGLEPRDLVISLVDCPRENWFFGRAETATDAIEETAP